MNSRYLVMILNANGCGHTSGHLTLEDASKHIATATTPQATLMVILRLQPDGTYGVLKQFVRDNV
jgi:hypothetical protein